MKSSQTFKWYEARELLDPDKWIGNDPDLMSEALTTSLSRLSSSHGVDGKSEEADEIVLKKFKPFYSADRNEEMSIFTEITMDNMYAENPPVIVRNIKSAETILRLQHRLSLLIDRLDKLDEKLLDIITDMKVYRNLSKLETIHTAQSNTLSSIFWIAWPIILLALTNKLNPK